MELKELYQDSLTQNSAGRTRRTSDEIYDKFQIKPHEQEQFKQLISAFHKTIQKVLTGATNN